MSRAKPILWSATRLSLAGALLALAGLVAVEEVDTKLVAPIVGLVLAAIALLVLTPGAATRLFGRIRSLNAFGIGVDFDQEAAAKDIDKKDEAPGSSSGGTASLSELRFRLEAKMAYIAKDLLPPPGGPAEFVTVGSLRHDGYITEEEARVAAGVLTLREADLLGLDPAVRDAELSRADGVVASIRASVLHGMVRRKLKEAEWKYSDHWFGRRRPDLIAEKGERRLRIAPVFALDGESGYLKHARERLEGVRTLLPRADRRVVVVPPESYAQPSEPDSDDDPFVVKAHELPGFLAREEARDA